MFNVADQRQFREATPTRQPGLPAGVTQADCDGPADELAGASEAELWRICLPGQREAIAQGFAQRHGDDLRDALLEAQDAAGLPGSAGSRTAHAGWRPARSPTQVLAAAIWRLWLAHRDGALNDLYRRGELSVSTRT
ncbi:MAG: hypothetical protein ABR964_00395 [Tepidisphaeraceae bacterium]